MPKTSAKKEYSIAQAAVVLGVSTKTLRRWENDGKLVPSERTKGGHRRYSGEQLAVFKNQAKSKSRKVVLPSVPSSASLISPKRRAVPAGKDIPHFYQSLHKAQKRAIFAVLAAMVLIAGGVGVANTSFGKSISGKLSINIKPNQNNSVISKSGSGLAAGRQVLQAATGAITFNINVPSIFKSTANFRDIVTADSDLSVGGDLAVTGDTDLGNLAVGGTLNVTGQSTLASTTLTDGSLIDLSGIIHDDTGLQGLLLPQNTSLTNPASGEGYLAYDSDDNKLKIYTGSTWADVTSDITDTDTNFFTETGVLTYLTDIESDFVLGGSTTAAPFYFDVSTGIFSAAGGGSFDPSFTTGSIPFQGASGLAEDNDNLFWDDTNNYLGVGTNTPSTTLDIVGNLKLASDASNLTGKAALIIDQNESQDILSASASGATKFTVSNTGNISAGGIGGQLIVDGTVYAQTCAGINAAIDALGASGGEIYLPEGTYTCAETITIDYNNTTIRGAGKGTNLDASSSQAFGRVINANSKDYLTFDNFTISGNAGGGASNYMIWATGTTHSKFTNLYLLNADDRTFSLEGASYYNVIANNYIENSDSYDIILQNGPAYNTVYGNTSIDAGNNAITLTQSISHNRIENNYINNATQWGIAVDSCSQCDVVGNITNGNAASSFGGISVTNSQSVSVSGNTSTGDYYGIYATSNGNSITGNTIYTPVEDGISITSDYNTITGNTIIDDGTADDAIALSATADYNNLSSNNISGFSGAGDLAISISSGAIDNIVTNNAFEGNNGNLSDSGTNTTIINSEDGKTGIGLASAQGVFHIQGNPTTPTGHAALIVDQYESQDIFTASASGSPVLTIQSDGDLQWANTETLGSVSAYDFRLTLKDSDQTFNVYQGGTRMIAFGASSAPSDAALGINSSQIFKNAALTIGGGTLGFDGSTTGRELTLSGVNAYASAATNLDGGNVEITGGSPVSTGLYGDVIIQKNGGKLGVGNASPVGLLDVDSTNTSTFGKALAIFNHDENQDLLTASASGATKFTVSNTGNISAGGIGGQLIVDGTVYAQTCAGINAAIDALGASGGEIYLPEGTYACDETITIDVNNITIRGAGKGTIIDVTQGASALQTFDVFNLNLKDYTTFKDFKVIGGAGGGNAFDIFHGANSNYADYVTFDSLYITNSDQYGIYYRGTYATIINNVFEGNDSLALSWISSGNTGARIANNYSDGGISSYGNNSAITGNSLNGGQITVNGDYVTVTGNSISNSGNGIVTGGAADHLTITGNSISISGSGAAGISLGNPNTFNTVTGNVIVGDNSSTSQRGIYRAGSTSNNLIANNIIKDLSGGGSVGVTIGSGDSDNKIINNEFENVATLISDAGTNTTIINSEDGKTGIGLAAAEGVFHIQGNPTTPTGHAALIVDQYETQDIFTASTSGTPAFAIDSAGGISLIDQVAHSINDVGGDLTLTSNSSNVDILDSLNIDTGTADGIALVIDQDDVDQTALDLDVNNVSGDVINLDWGGSTTLTGAATGLDLDFTNVTADGSNAFYGLRINDNAAATGSTEYGLYQQGTTWDYGAYFEDDVFFDAGITTGNLSGMLIVDGTNYAQTCAGINAAIDALGASGGEIYLPEGSYACDQTITIDYNNTTIRGAGKGTIIDVTLGSSAVQDFNVFTLNGADHTTFKDFKVIGDAGGGNSFDIFNDTSGAYSDYLTFDHLYITNSDRYGLYYRGTYATITNNIFEGNDSSPISWANFGNTGARIANNYADGNIGSYGNNSIITGNTVSGGQINANGNSVTVTGNSVVSASGSGNGILVGGNVSYVTVTGNSISIVGSGVAGISLGNPTTYSNITGNVIAGDNSSGNQRGVYSQAGADYNLIANNVIKDLSGGGSVGITLASGDTENQVINNDFTNVATIISDSGADTHLVNSKLGKTGIGLAAAEGVFHIKANPTTTTGHAALIVDQYEAQDIFTASASGTPAFAIDSAGGISLIDQVAHFINDVGGDLTLTSDSTSVDIADNLDVSGTTGLTLSGTGGEIAFALGETIDNDADGSIVLTETGGQTLTFDLDATAPLISTSTDTLAINAATDIYDTSATAFTLGDGSNTYFTFDGSTDAGDTLFAMTGASSGITSGKILSVAADTITSGNGLDISLDGLVDGNGIYVESTSTALTTGDLASIYWNPGSSTTATGNILTLNVGSNGTIGNILDVQDAGSSVFSVSQSKITSALPHEFTAAGDVSFAYDAIFTNQTASYIKSYGPLTIEAGESFESNDLTLKTYNSGDVVIDSHLFVSNSQTSGKALAIFNQTESQDLLTASASGATKFTVSNTGNISAGGIGGQLIVDGTVYAQTCAGINAAIDALGSAGGEIYLPEGSYACDETITIDFNNTTIRGAGKGTIIDVTLGAAATQPATAVINLNGKDYITISDLNILGDDDGLVSSDLILANGTTDSVIANNYLQDSDGKGISLANGSNNHILNNNILDPDGNGIHLATATYNEISGNNISNAGADNIYLSATSDYNTIASNSIENVVGGNAIDIYQSDNVVVDGNLIDGGGIHLQSGTGNTVSNNQINGSATGITVSADANHVIIGNHLVNQTNIGISNLANYVTISGNTIVTPTNDGIVLQNSLNSTVSNNNIYDDGTGDDGIELQSTSNYNLITSNNISGFSGASDTGIKVVGTGNVVSNNIFQDVNVTLSDSGTDTTIINSASGKTGIGLAAAEGVFHIKANPTTTTGEAALIVDQYEAQDIFTASTSGTPAFAIDSAGGISLLDQVAHSINDVSGDLTLTSNSTSVDIADNLEVAGVATVIGQADAVQMIIKQNATQSPTNPTFQIQNSAGSPIFEIAGSASTDVFIGVDAGDAVAQGTATRSVGIGYGALGALNLATAYNVGVGYSALAGGVTNFSRNIGIGANALDATNVGLVSGNVALGDGVLGALTSGSYNIGIGYRNLGNTTSGQQNIALGYGTLNDASLGDDNIGIGYQAGFSATGNKSVFIGYQAGYSETGSSKLYIDDSNSATPLILGDFSADDLTFYGNVEVDTGTGDLVAFTIDQDDVDQTALDIDVANTAADIVNIDWNGATVQTAALTGIDLDFSNLTSVAGSTTYGLHINDLSAQTTSTEYAIYQEGTNWDYGIYATDSVRFEGSVDFGTVDTFTDSDATPDVSGGSHFITNTSAVEITDFDAGAGTLATGHIIVIESAGAITYDFDAGNLNLGTEDIVTAAGDITTWIYDGSTWNLMAYMDDSDAHNSGNGFDLAEWYQSTQELMAGEIVSLDATQNWHIARSQGQADQNMVGVVSTSPGLVLGDTSSLGNNAYPVALSGRVPVKLSSTSENIEVGDYITSSNENGLGQKATGPGMVVGRALEHWSPETGSQSDPNGDTVLVFVQLMQYDPNLTLTDTGELSLGLNSLGEFEITRTGYGVVDQIGTFSNLVVADLEVGKLQATQIFLGDQNLSELMDSSAINQQAQIDLLSQSVTDLQAQDYENLTAQVDEHEQRITDLEAQLATASASLAAAQNDIAQLQEDIKFASFSAVLGDSAIATDSATLANLVVAGDTILSNTTITGSLDIGTIQVDGFANSINSLGTLQIQPLSLADVEFMNGLVKIDTLGNISTQEITAEKYNVSGESAGSETLYASEQSIYIYSDQVTDNSLIFVTPHNATSRQLAVTQKDSGIGFEVTISLPITQDIEFDWLIIDKQPDALPN